MLHEPQTTRIASDRAWSERAIEHIEADFNRSAGTHLIRLDIPGLSAVRVYLKDESTHPTGSLKHRLARSLYLYGLCNDWIHDGTTVIEASSGNTAISEAYFARLLGLPFVAVVPRETSHSKIEQIAFYGGRCHLVEAEDIYAESQRLARELRGHYMDQFTYAERATDWRGNNNIAESIFHQMHLEPDPVPAWIVVSAGTGGTSATIGRYIRFRRYATRLCVADPEHSVFFHYFTQGSVPPEPAGRSLIEGIGRPRVEPSFLPRLIDRMIRVPDSASIAALHYLEGLINRKCGGSTGTNFYAALVLAAEMQARGERGSVVTMIGDSGERYLETLYDEDWRRARRLEIEPELERLSAFHRRGKLIHSGCSGEPAPRFDPP